MKVNKFYNSILSLLFLLQFSITALILNPFQLSAGVLGYETGRLQLPFSQRFKLHVNGTNAYIGNYSTGSLHIVDISDEKNPQLESTTLISPAAPATVHDIWYSNNNVYISHRYGGISKIDVTNPLQPLVNYKYMFTTYSHNGLITAYNQTLQKEFLYAAEHQNSFPFRIYDPATYQQLGTYSAGITDGREIEVTSDGTFLFQANVGATPCISIYNVSNPSNITLINRIFVFAHEMVISPDNRYLYILNDYNADNKIEGFMVFDISDPSRPAFKNNINIPGAKELAVDHSGKRVFIRTRSDLAATPVPTGIYAYDISNISKISQIDFLKTSADFEDFDMWYDNNHLYYLDNTAQGSQFIVLNTTGIRPNNPPVISNQNLQLNEDNSIQISVVGSDPDGDPLTYTVTSSPVHGTLTGTVPSLTYTPDANFNGSDQFNVSVSDGKLSSSATILITVNPVNDPPVIELIPPKTATEGTNLTFNVVVTDVDNDVLTLSADNLPTGATFANGTFNWTPDYNQAGSYNVYFSAIDPSVTVTQNVTITVANLNRVPVANAQSVTTDEDNAVAVTLSGSDPDGDVLTYTIGTQPVHGTLSGTAPNLTYTPEANYNGSDEITFSVSDGSMSAQATVSITVNAINDIPVFNTIAAQAIQEISTLTFTATGSDIDGDALTFSASNLPDGASFTNGTFTWNPTYVQSGSYTITVFLSDGHATVTQDVAITVTNLNRTPVANAQSITTDEDNTVAVTLSGSDPDGDALSYIVVTQPSHGTLSGTAPNLTYTPNANYNGSDEIVFSVSDGSLSSQATISITINAVNDVPVLNTIAAQSVEETSTLIFTATGSDIDADALTFAASNLPEGASFSNGIFTWTPTYVQAGSYTVTISLCDGKVTVTQDVAITVSNLNRTPMANAQSVTTDEDNAVAVTLTGSDPDGDALKYAVVTQPAHGTLSGTAPNLTYTPDANYNGNDEIVFSVSDGSLSSQATVSITVNAVNDIPVLNTINAQSVEETSTLTFTATGSDIDADALTLTASNLPEGASFSNGTFTWTPTYVQAGSYNVTVSLSDGNATVTQDVAITVTNLNRTPVANAQSITTDEDNAVAVTLSGSDPDGDALKYAVVNQPAHGTLSGTAPNLTYIPDANYNGNDEIVFSVSDGSLSAQAAVSITVNAVNDIPVLNTIAAQSVEETSTLTFTVTGSDIDADALIFTGSNLPEGAAFSNGTFTWTPTYAQAGSYTITVSLSDGNVTVTQDVAITVTNLNRAPVANAQSITTDEDNAVAVALSGSDPDGDGLKYAVVTQPAHGTLSGTAPNLTYTPNANYNGSDAITFSVSDGSLSAQAAVSITAKAINDAPVVNAISTKTVNENSLLTFTVTGSDVDGDALVFSASNLPAWATFTNGTFTWTPAFDQAGSYSITVTASDGKLSSSRNVTISVINTTVKAKVYMYDEATTNPVASNPRLYIVNTSNEVISDCRIEYYFSSENGKVPQLDQYYIANAKVTLASRGNGDYTIVYDLTGVSIAPGAIYPNTGGMVVGIHYQDWSNVDVTNDYSNNHATAYSENGKICIYKKDNSLLGGLKPSVTGILPFANAGSDVWSTSQLVTLDGSHSYDLLGQVASYAWIINGNVVSTNVKPVIAFNYGVTTVILRVTNTAGLTSTDETTIYVHKDTEVLFSLTNSPVLANTPVTVEYDVPSKIANASITLEAQNAWGGTNVLTVSGTAGYHKEQIWSWNKDSFGGSGPWTVRCKVNGVVKQTLVLKFGY